MVVKKTDSEGDGDIFLMNAFLYHKVGETLFGNFKSLIGFHETESK